MERYRGKVELDWGGVTMEMSPAAVMNILTTAAIVEENDKKVQQDAIGGESTGMGNVTTRIVVLHYISRTKPVSCQLSVSAFWAGR
ncbi:hypothetical protein E4U22_005085 [Claviceps purpurea]|nr:hypothetical protein E4U12_002356 [Claviceps purpurea]KAG6146863.1 hypothetical protein E4U28_008194 [Claviceps purpurea]KAG6216017.1 hypothetical protein E4U50_006626 [Claviceps purpurea]KAG6241643.1 hypothetical protein E4U24_006024 [Claviceps purpurea]KAG6271375.1 hypothetical protein E4U49_004144 [Claviceps purpurea]